VSSRDRNEPVPIFRNSVSKQVSPEFLNLHVREKGVCLCRVTSASEPARRKLALTSLNFLYLPRSFSIFSAVLVISAPAAWPSAPFCPSAPAVSTSLRSCSFSMRAETSSSCLASKSDLSPLYFWRRASSSARSDTASRPSVCLSSESASWPSLEIVFTNRGQHFLRLIHGNDRRGKKSYSHLGRRAPRAPYP
jgi:hypothetical protein